MTVPTPDDLHGRIAAMYRDELASMSVIAQTLRLSPGTVRTILVDAGARLRSPAEQAAISNERRGTAGGGPLREWPAGAPRFEDDPRAPKWEPPWRAPSVMDRSYIGCAAALCASGTGALA